MKPFKPLKEVYNNEYTFTLSPMDFVQCAIFCFIASGSRLSVHSFSASFVEKQAHYGVDYLYLFPYLIFPLVLCAGCFFSHLDIFSLFSRLEPYCLVLPMVETTIYLAICEKKNHSRILEF